MLTTCSSTMLATTLWPALKSHSQSLTTTLSSSVLVTMPSTLVCTIQLHHLPVSVPVAKSNLLLHHATNPWVVSTLHLLPTAAQLPTIASSQSVQHVMESRDLPLPAHPHKTFLLPVSICYLCVVIFISSCKNANTVFLGLFAPNEGQAFRDKQRRQASQYDRGTPGAEIELAAMHNRVVPVLPTGNMFNATPAYPQSYARPSYNAANDLNDFQRLNMN